MDYCIAETSIDEGSSLYQAPPGGWTTVTGRVLTETTTVQGLECSRLMGPDNFGTFCRNGRREPVLEIIIERNKPIEAYILQEVGSTQLLNIYEDAAFKATQQFVYGRKVEGEGEEAEGGGREEEEKEEEEEEEEEGEEDANPRRALPPIGPRHHT
ncbi:hypothetical protein SprV_0200522300 [Sparganum proliferum]